MDNWYDGTQGLAPRGAIGVFDSGVGGLTVLRALETHLPRESFLYFADTARLPYGSRSRSEILQYVREILTWMQQRGIKMAVMACNTSSALALEQVRCEFPFPIVGLIEPAAQAAVMVGQRIGIMATPATVKSGVYPRLLQRYAPHVAIAQVPCPDFVPLIESNCLEGEQVRRIVQRTLAPLVEFGLDTLVYGCTHYPHLRHIIQDYVPDSVYHLDPATAVAHTTAHALKALSLQAATHQGRTYFYASGTPEQFARLASQWLGFYPRVEHVPLSVLSQTVDMTLPTVPAAAAR